jgi:hypothetical protein
LLPETGDINEDSFANTNADSGHGDHCLSGILP